MTNADRPKLAELLAMLSETFNEPMSEMRAEGYFIALQEFALDDIRDAVQEALKTAKFFPRPAELRELIIGNAEFYAAVSWSHLLAQVRHEGYTGKPTLEKLEHDVIRELWGSWRGLCETLPATGVELMAWEKRFRQAYGRAHRLDTRKRLNAMTRKELSE